MSVCGGEDLKLVQIKNAVIKGSVSSKVSTNDLSVEDSCLTWNSEFKKIGNIY